MYCSNCGKEIDDKAVVCIYCGCATINMNNYEPQKVTVLNSNYIDTTKSEDKDWFLVLCLAILGGFLGLHRFYTGYIGIGLFQFLTCGGFGVWWFIDVLSILLKGYRCADGGRLI